MEVSLTPRAQPKCYKERRRAKSKKALCCVIGNNPYVKKMLNGGKC